MGNIETKARLNLPSYPEGFTKDGRSSIWKLYKDFEKLSNVFGWIKEPPIYVQKLETRTGPFEFPIEVFRTSIRGPAFWVFAGIHGEEPAGPNAIASNIEVLGDLGRKIPMVVFPLCNPSGYWRNWRYPNEDRDKDKRSRECSVGDSDWLLPDLNSPAPKSRKPNCDSSESCCLILRVLELSSDYPPLISFDHHEDECHKKAPYIYSQGKLGIGDPIAQKVVEILKELGLPVEKGGKDEEGRDIIGGIVDFKNDGSVDELMGSNKIVFGGRFWEKNSAESVVVVETPIIRIPLERRIRAHARIIQAYPEFWQMIRKQELMGF